MKFEIDDQRTFIQNAEEARFIAMRRGIAVTFDFNTVTCIVNKNTDLGLLEDEYRKAQRRGMGSGDGGTIGPCYKPYTK